MAHPGTSERGSGRPGRALAAAITLLLQLLVPLVPHSDDPVSVRLRFADAPSVNSQHAPCVACTVSGAATVVPAAPLLQIVLTRQSLPDRISELTPRTPSHPIVRSRAPPTG